MEVTTRPSRLGLARVSVVRGEGALEGTACIDDYIRSPEAVHDYLTRFSGIVPGDLDPARSPHCLTTLRRAYLKLRYLVDSGVRFVGHGLKQDFRMINILVPSEQVGGCLGVLQGAGGSRCIGDRGTERSAAHGTPTSRLRGRTRWPPLFATHCQTHA